MFTVSRASEMIDGDHDKDIGPRAAPARAVTVENFRHRPESNPRTTCPGYGALTLLVLERHVVN